MKYKRSRKKYEREKIIRKMIRRKKKRGEKFWKKN
jgi:hypothetical protein